MAKASESLVASRNSHNPAIAAAAERIVELINSRPVSPREDEVAAILERTIPATGVSAPKHRTEWDTLMSSCKAVEKIATDLEMAAAVERINDCARRIWSEPVRGPADVMLLAEVCYWTFWTEPAGLRSPDADASLTAGATHADLTGVYDEAFAALLRGVRAAFGDTARVG